MLALLFHTVLNMTWLYLPLSLFADWRVVLTHCLVALVVVLVSKTYLGRKARARPEEE